MYVTGYVRRCDIKKDLTNYVIHMMTLIITTRMTNLYVCLLMCEKQSRWKKEKKVVKMYKIF